jgi:hypothetical protein
MKLTELEPRWLHPNLFVFKCPHCRKDWLACGAGFIKCQDQFDLYEKEFGPDWNLIVIPRPEQSPWTVSGTDFASLTVVPSIDASRSGEGHWHGCITNGEIK